ncbi:enoyl-CoA hydratase/isomerase family protein [Melaminivora alkalimesophila]|uniref:Enoyl-CoA hydratase/carnithine racemase n=1 Tax=Melaminivora alkalimesophila TaxID=1165852 RepID=A0A317R8R8_9BURK|nr:enoyl-CoA hydratase/isomerase family protein [Melaminivora alkalimesophila]PWW44541.1 enoyl-CoA hydratase/carnithine racemase [Melaminivora alkalimesophila]
MSGQVELQPSGAGEVPGLVRVVLRHEGRLNAMTRAMWRELRAVFERIQADPQARCVLMEGAGEAFCAGGDISEYPAFRFDAAQLRDFHEGEVWGGLSAMLGCDVPVVAAIAGACMGAGVEIASCCDVRIAAADARFGAPIARLGFPMAPREAALVASAVGEGVARQMLLEAATFDAGRMFQLGFLARVVEPEALRREALLSARRIAGLAPAAARMNKQTLRAWREARAPWPADAHDPYAYADSAEHREGITAFLAKRPPAF